MECIVCGKIIGSGINIKGNKICLECEEKIINCDTTNEEYDVYLNKIKKNIVEKYMIWKR